MPHRVALGVCSPILAFFGACRKLATTETEAFAEAENIAEAVSAVVWGLIIATALWRAQQCGDLVDYIAAVFFSTIYVITSVFIRCRPKAYAE